MNIMDTYLRQILSRLWAFKDDLARLSGGPSDEQVTQDGAEGALAAGRGVPYSVHGSKEGFLEEEARFELGSGNEKSSGKDQNPGAM